ncbi:MAG: tetratricopeptide repeat protein, partial [Desulfobacteraceae bacterium]|nr:tetratricopeptide repeat protein [Desulfobacteraceae bacterium]
MAYANLGIVYLRMGSFDKAEEWLQKAIKMQ